MPTYTVTAPEGRLSERQKAAVAAGITRVHNAVTNAPTYFAQVLFVDVRQGNYFVGGKLLAEDQIFVHGQIRAGRTDTDKQRLLHELIDSVVLAAEASKTSVWVYILDLPASQMAEFGHVLPEPGQEAAWAGALPAADRERMKKTGR
jgi:phenylpyruvate tautomerase PptA (4-oxalocrotonate tautomerase family)